MIESISWKMALPYVLFFIVSVLANGAALWISLRQAASSRETFNQVTGGESFAYLEPLRQPGRVIYLARQTGDHPTYDVVVRIQEIVLGEGAKKRHGIFGPVEVGQMLRRGSGFDWTAPDRDQQDKPLAWPLVFYEPPRPGDVLHEFRIELAARNGIVIQRIRAWPSGERWHTASKQVADRRLPPFREAQDQEITPIGDRDDAGD
jgi:hypothetical protein